MIEYIPKVSSHCEHLRECGDDGCLVPDYEDPLDLEETDSADEKQSAVF